MNFDRSAIFNDRSVYTNDGSMDIYRVIVENVEAPEGSIWIYDPARRLNSFTALDGTVIAQVTDEAVRVLVRLPDTSIQDWSYDDVSSTYGAIIAPAYPTNRFQYERTWKQCQEAEKIAHETLRQHLNEEQQRTLDKADQFDVTALSGTVYRIRRTDAYGISDGDHTYCLDVLEDLPVYDVMLMQKLIIEADEAQFLHIANRKEICDCDACAVEMD